MRVFEPEAKEAVDHFVCEGYAVYRGMHNSSVVDWFRHEIELHLATHGRRDLHAASVRIMAIAERTSEYRAIVSSPLLIATLGAYLGSDICILGFDALWINAPKDKSPVLLKGIHSDAWTGTSVNTIFVKTFFTDCDRYNGITVYPGSHLQGMWPVRNRALGVRVKIKGVNLKDIKAGDVLMWHPLLLHATTGHSAKNTRISMTSRYTSTETPFSSQERALGYRTLSVGPMGKIMRLVGNDYATPMRTLGGVVAIDKRMAEVYG